MYNRGVAKVKLRDYLGSLPDLNKAIERNPQNARACYYRSVARENTQDHSGALADILRLSEMDPTFYFPEKYNDLECEEIHEHIKILTECNKAINNHTLLLEPYRKRADLKEAAKDYMGAIADLSKIIALDYRDETAYSKRGFIRSFFMKDYRGALSDYNYSLNFYPDNREILMSRSTVKFFLEDYQGALADLNRIIESYDPSDPEDEEDHTYIMKGAIQSSN